jgi:AcrR family transcriptional regulator
MAVENFETNPEVVAVKAMHPTKRAILDAAIADMEATGEGSIRITTILKEAGVANGSLYHYFGSREGLVQEAIAERFLGAVSQGLVVFAARVAEVSSTEELFDLFRSELARIGTPDVQLQRVRRFTALAAALPRKELLGRVVQDQTVYFDGAGLALANLQKQGIINSSIDTRAFAAWFLGLSLSRLLSDIDPKSEPEKDWSDFTMQALIAILTPAPADTSASVKK